jgi:integrase
MNGKPVLIFSRHGHGYGGHLSVTPRVGEFLNFSLQTADDGLAGQRGRDAEEHIERLFRLHELEPTTATMHDLVGLAGVAYRLIVDINFRDPGTPEQVARFKALNRAAAEARLGSVPPLIPTEIDRDGAVARELFPGHDLTEAVDSLEAGKHDGALEARFGIIGDFVLISHEVRLTTDNRRDFLRHVGQAAIDAGWSLKRNSEGDFRPDPQADRFPAIDKVEVIRPKVSFADLVTGWSKEARARGLSKRTINDLYPQAIERLKTYLKHDNPAKVTTDDILAYKAIRQETVTAKTWKDADLPPLKAIFGWAVKNRKLPFNPAASVSGERVKRNRSRDPDFSDAEASAIFAAALTYQGGEKEDPKTAAAKKWVPILLAYTGARLGEITQLRKKDIRKESGRHIIKILPEAGTVKGGQFRDVPLHAHPIELGFLQFVEESADGALFVNSDNDGNATGLKGINKRITDFIRSIVTDKAVQPNHGWRHRFKTLCLEDGTIAERTIDKIQGQKSTKNASGNYGSLTIKAMARAIKRFPRVKIVDAPPGQKDAGAMEVAPAVFE